MQKRAQVNNRKGPDIFLQAEHERRESPVSALCSDPAEAHQSWSPSWSPPWSSDLPAGSCVWTYLWPKPEKQHKRSFYMPSSIVKLIFGF